MGIFCMLKVAVQWADPYGRKCPQNKQWYNSWCSHS